MQVKIYTPRIEQVQNPFWDRDRFPTVRGCRVIDQVTVELPERVPANDISVGDWVVIATPRGWDTIRVIGVFDSRRDATLAVDLPELTRRIVPDYGHTFNFDARNAYCATEADIAARLAHDAAEREAVAAMERNGRDMLAALADGARQADEDA